MFLVATLKPAEPQVSEVRPKVNSIKLLEEAPTAAPNRSTTIHSGITKKYNILAQVRLLETCLTTFTHSAKWV